MPEKKKPDNTLDLPEGITAIGTVKDLQDAYLKSILAIPELLIELQRELADINSSLAVIALYAEKSGLSQSILTNEDIESLEDNDDNIDNETISDD